MISVGLGKSEGIDTESVTKKAISTCMIQINRKAQFRDEKRLTLSRLLILPEISDPGRQPINRH